MVKYIAVSKKKIVIIIGLITLGVILAFFIGRFTVQKTQKLKPTLKTLNSTIYLQKEFF